MRYIFTTHYSNPDKYIVYLVPMGVINGNVVERLRRVPYGQAFVNCVTEVTEDAGCIFTESEKCKLRLIWHWISVT